MRPVVTWIVLANSRLANVVVHCGPGKGFVAKKDLAWSAPDTIDFADKAGTARSSTTSATVTFGRSDPDDIAQAAFAKDIACGLAGLRRDGAFNRLIVSAAPHMLGELRKALDKTELEGAYQDVSKDLTHIPPQDLGPHLEHMVAV